MAQPWSVVVVSGSGDAWRFAGGPEAAAWAFAPMTPVRSSSGVYCGGEPRSGALTDEPALWAHVVAVQSDRAHHTEQRRKGTAALVVSRPAGDVTTLATGPAVDALLAWCAGLR